MAESCRDRRDRAATWRAEGGSGRGVRSGVGGGVRPTARLLRSQARDTHGRLQLKLDEARRAAPPRTPLTTALSTPSMPSPVQAIGSLQAGVIDAARVDGCWYFGVRVASGNAAPRNHRRRRRNYRPRRVPQAASRTCSAGATVSLHGFTRPSRRLSTSRARGCRASLRSYHTAPRRSASLRCVPPTHSRATVGG